MQVREYLVGYLEVKGDSMSTGLCERGTIDLDPVIRESENEAADHDGKAFTGHMDDEAEHRVLSIAISTLIQAP